MPQLPLDEEQHFAIAPLGGQQSRPSVTAVEPGKAAIADGSYHHAGDLRSAPGTAKLISTPIPGSAYELNGRATGFLHIPSIPGTDYTADWAVEFNIKLLNAGGINSADNASSQTLCVSGLDFGIGGDSDTEGRCLRLVLVAVPNPAPPPYDDDLFLRVFWGGTQMTDIPLNIGSGANPIDLEDWFKVHIGWAATPESITITLRQPQNYASARIQALVRVGVLPRVDYWQLGGRISSIEPTFGHRNICPCVVSEFRHYSDDAGGKKNTYERRVPGDPIETTLTHVWPLDDSETLAIRSVPTGVEGRMTGNRVHRDVLTNFGSGDGHALRFDGSGMLFIPNSHKFREPPNGLLPGYYLERPEITFGFIMRADPHRPFKRPEGWKDDPDEERAVLLNWTTPECALWGRPETYGSYHGTRDAAAGDTFRPCEHLKVELAKDTGTGYYYIRALWGELDQLSLDHVPGVPGGSTGQVWPPAKDGAGMPAQTFNNPQGADGTGGTVRGWNDFRSRGAQAVILGHETSGILGVDDPMQYDWLIIVERKWVAQGDSGNECRVIALPMDQSTGLWLPAASMRYVTAAATAGYGLDETVADGTKLPPIDQSCFTLDYQGVIGVNYRPEVYAMTLGDQCNGQYGDEWMDNAGVWQGKTNKGIYPAQGDGPGFTIDQRAQGLPFVGWIKDFFVLKKYISITDAKRIAAAGGFAEAMRVHFGRDILASYTFTEGAGNLIREMKGNDILFEDKIITTNVTGVTDDEKIDPAIGMFPRVPPAQHNEVDLYEGEFSPVTGLVQRLDFEGNEEIYVTSQPGLYRYRRSNNDLQRVLTLPGQGGPGRASIVVDDADIIHIAGGPGRPVIITRDKTVALSGIQPPLYQAPDTLVTMPTGIAGGVGINVNFRQDTNIDNLVGWEIPDGQQVTLSIGYWSDVLKTRSAPGAPIVCRFTDPATPAPSTQPVKQHRILLSGLPLPDLENASLVTHWEIYRTAVNGNRMYMETRVPINDTPGTALVGYKLDTALVEQADYFRAPPPEGMKYLGHLGERLIGVGLPTNPRSLVWSRLRESTTFPPIYEYTLTHTSSPAVGVRARRDRAFVVSRDYLYQLFDKLGDVDPDGRLTDSVIITPITEGVGALNQDAIADDEENGLYLFGNKSVYLTEGGTFNSVSQDNDSFGAVGGSWSWPDSWDLSDPDAFVTFHDEARRCVGICGPSADDPNRRDAMVIFYESIKKGALDQYQVSVDMSRVLALNATVFANVFDPTTGKKEVWFGSDLGYLYKMGSGSAMGVDYSWLSAFGPKYGVILSAATTTTARLEGSYAGAPAEFMVGAHLRVYRDGALISTRRVIASTVSASWVDVVLDGVHSAVGGDHWTIGAIPLHWMSGEMDMGDALQDFRVLDVDLRLKRV